MLGGSKGKLMENSMDSVGNLAGNASDCEVCTRYDLVVIGAGPHSLSLLARILEKFPVSLFSDTEHSRLHRLHSGKSHQKKLNYHADSENKRILVIDKYGQWMERWDRSFEAYDIKYLRSPLSFHMDPTAPDSLSNFAHSHGRHDELHDITHIVDNDCPKSHRKNKSKCRLKNFNQIDREQFYTPSTLLFADFVKELIDRYSLNDMLTQGVCTRVDVCDKGGFKVTYDCAEDGCTKSTTIFADAVVGAIGNTNINNYPDFFHVIPGFYPTDRLAHSNDFIDCLTSEFSEHACPVHGQDHKEIIPKSLSLKLKSSQPCSLLIVGGGLTSAQMVHVAIQRGFSSVVLLLRSHLKVRQFDFSLDIMGRQSGPWYADFWTEPDFKRRLQLIRQARDGGSVTPEYASLLREYESKGLLTIHIKSKVASCEWIPESGDDGTWKVAISGPNEIESRFDQIWLATGSVFNMTKEPIFKDVVEKLKVEMVNGLPILTPDLQLHPDLDFFVMSGYSSLMLGPTAANIQGGRLGAERIARRLWKKWTNGDTEDITTKMRPRGSWNMSDMAANMGNYFSALVDEEETEG